MCSFLPHYGPLPIPLHPPSPQIIEAQKRLIPFPSKREHQSLPPADVWEEGLLRAMRRRGGDDLVDFAADRIKVGEGEERKDSVAADRMVALDILTKGQCPASK